MGANKYRFWPATLLTLAVSLLILGWQGLLTLAAASLLALAIGGFFNSRLGGLTGDVCGAIRKVTEAAMLIVIPAVAGLF